MALNFRITGKNPSPLARRSGKRKTCFWNSLRVKNTKQETTGSIFRIQTKHKIRDLRKGTERALCDRGYLYSPLEAGIASV